MALQLKRDNKHNPGLLRMTKLLRAFLIVSCRAGWSKTTGRLYWKIFFITLLKNPAALELVLNMAAMYLFLSRQFQFIKNLTARRIESYQKSPRQSQLSVENVT